MNPEPIFAKKIPNLFIPPEIHDEPKKPPVSKPAVVNELAYINLQASPI